MKIRKLLHRNSTGFTLLEFLIALGLLCMLCWGVGTYRTFVATYLFRAHVIAFHTRCVTAQMRATLTKKSVYLQLDSVKHTYQFSDERPYSFGCLLVPAPGTYGPPSKPKKLIIQPVVGAKKCDYGYKIAWTKQGLTRPATIYLSNSIGMCAAITLPRAQAAPIRLYWRKDATSWESS